MRDDGINTRAVSCHFLSDSSLLVDVSFTSPCPPCGYRQKIPIMSASIKAVPASPTASSTSAVEDGLAQMWNFVHPLLHPKPNHTPTLSRPTHALPPAKRALLARPCLRSKKGQRTNRNDGSNNRGTNIRSILDVAKGLARGSVVHGNSTKERIAGSGGDCNVSCLPADSLLRRPPCSSANATRPTHRSPQRTTTNTALRELAFGARGTPPFTHGLEPSPLSAPSSWCLRFTFETGT